MLRGATGLGMAVLLRERAARRRAHDENENARSQRGLAFLHRVLLLEKRVDRMGTTTARRGRL
jgi:hypothetical protein